MKKPPEVRDGKDNNCDPNAFFLDNNDPNNWCNSPAGHEIPDGDEATPGAPNVDCR